MVWGQKGGWFRSPLPGSDAVASTSKKRGDAAEDAALHHLQGHGLRLVQRNFRTPGRGGGEIDLIMREPDGTLVFVEVRQRATSAQGGAAGSVTAVKQRRIVLAARHFLQRLGSEPACRFDVVLIQGGAPVPGAVSQTSTIAWLKAAFDASATF